MVRIRSGVAAITAAIIAFWLGLPLSWRKAGTDFWTYALTGITTLSVALPDNGNWRNWALGVGLAVLGVILNAVRRSWLTNKDAVLGATVELVAQETGFELTVAQIEAIAESVARRLSSPIVSIT